MAFDPNKITFFARTDARGKNVQFGIKAKDRQRHVYVIGKTGMGKSTLLENMAVQDIQNGEGLAFIDPHGRSAETLLDYIPEHRIKDVLYFAPSDTSSPVSFNIMEDVGADKRHLVVSGLMSVFKKIWVDAWSARMEYILSNTLLALLEYPESTLLGVNRMLSDKDYRNLVVANVKDPGVKSFWVDEFAKYNERYMQEAGDAIKNKIGQFTSNPIIRNIVGQPKSSFDIRTMMDEKKILIMNLSKGLIGETNASLLGSMLTTRIYLAAMSRADLSPEKMNTMPNFYFYVDEFQSFANASFANILSEARKYHLNLTIANQYIDQMEEEVRNAVFGNVGTTITFRVGPFDAEVLETIFTPQFLATDIVNLSFAQIYLTLMIDGIGSQPFSATTLPPIAPPASSCKDMAIASSREQFTKPRAEVEEGIHKFHERVEVPRKVEKPRTPDRPYAERKEFVAKKIDQPVEVKKEVSIPTEIAQPVKEPVPPVVEEIKKEIVEVPKEVVRSVETEKPKHDTPHHQSYLPRVKPQTEDLRSVLKRIASADMGDKKEQQQQPPKKAVDGERTELKAALSSILKQQSPQQKIEVVEKPIPAPVQKQDVPATSVVAPTPTPPTPPTSTPQISTSTPTPVPEIIPQKVVAESAPPSPKEVPPKIIHEDSMPTPKELERMMRVTTSDKPPL